MTALLIIIIFLLVAVDQLTKIIMILWLKPLGTFELVPNFVHFKFVENSGAAFSMLQNARWFFIVLTSICIAACVYIIVSNKIKEKYPVFKNKIVTAALVLISAGGAGNLIDRIFRGGKVVDFIEPLFVNFAVFNFADSLVTVGAFILIIYLIYDIIKDFKSRKRLKKDE